MGLTASTVAAIAAVTTIAGSAVSAYGAIQQGNAAKQQADREAKAQQMQGALANENAMMEAANLRVEQQRVAASQVVSGAGAGISLGSGSLLDLMDETSSAYESDYQQTLRTGKLSYAASNYSAGSLRSAGRTSRTAGYFNAGGTLLSGLGTSMGYANKAGWFD